MLENTVAIFETAFGVAQRCEPAGRAIEDIDPHDGLADVLPIRADILNRGRARRSRNSREAFDPRPPFCDRHGDKLVPRLGGGGRHRAVGCLDTAKIEMKDETMEAFIADQHIAAAGQNEQRLTIRLRPFDGVAHFLDAARVREEFRRSADAERREGGQGDIAPHARQHGGTKYCSIVAVLRPTAIYAALLAATCLVVFAPAYSAGITNWDDDVYLRAPASLTTYVMGNYHPLTMLSYAISGRNPAVLHATNVALHAITAVLLFFLLLELTASQFPAFVGALIWAIHPLRVESVVWISERKDVLCGLFYVAALIAYVRKKFWLTLAFFILALLSKGMAVSFPLALVAIDFLQRRRITLRDKIPFFALSILFGAIGYAAQRVTTEFAEKPLPLSAIEKALFSFRAIFFYLGKLVFLVKLSAFYRYPNAITLADWIAPLLLVILGLFAMRVRSLAFAYFFFIATIAVILSRVIGEGSRMTMLIAIVAAALGVMTFERSKVWHDSVSLWSSVIEYDPHVALPYNARGVALAQQGHNAAALRDLNAAIEIDSCYAMALRNRIVVENRLGDAAGVARDRDRLSRCQR